MALGVVRDGARRPGPQVQLLKPRLEPEDLTHREAASVRDDSTFALQTGSRSSDTAWRSWATTLRASAPWAHRAGSGAIPEVSPLPRARRRVRQAPTTGSPCAEATQPSSGQRRRVLMRSTWINVPHRRGRTSRCSLVLRKPRTGEGRAAKSPRSTRSDRPPSRVSHYERDGSSRQERSGEPSGEYLVRRRAIRRRRPAQRM